MISAGTARQPFSRLRRRSRKLGAISRRIWAGRAKWHARVQVRPATKRPSSLSRASRPKGETRWRKSTVCFERRVRRRISAEAYPPDVRNGCRRGSVALELEWNSRGAADPESCIEVAGRPSTRTLGMRERFGDLRIIEKRPVGRASIPFAAKPECLRAERERIGRIHRGRGSFLRRGEEFGSLPIGTGGPAIPPDRFGSGAEKPENPRAG